MSTKVSKSSSVAEQSKNKTTPKVVNRLSRTASKSDFPADPSTPLKTSRLSVDRSPRSYVSSKPTPADRRSPKLTSTPDKPQTRVSKGSELQAQLSLLQEDLKNAKEKLVLIENEKSQAVEGLKDAQRSAEEANEKLREAQVAQKRAEENSEIEKFRAVEMEQAAIESTQKKEEEWKKELEAVRNQHALDISALSSAAEELEKVKQELATNLDAKNQAISRFDDVTKISEAHVQKIVSLSAEVARLMALLDSKHDNEADDTTRLVSELDQEIEVLKQELDKAKGHEQILVEMETLIGKLHIELESAKFSESSVRKSMEESQNIIKELEAQAGESTQLVSELDLEIHTLKQELEEAKSYEEKLVEKEACMHKLNIELEAAELAESNAHKSVEEWKKKVKELEAWAEESNRLERSASESLESVMKQLEGSNDLLHDAQSEIASLREKVGLLEFSITRQRGDLEESGCRLSMAKAKAAEMTNKAEALGYELENVEEEKNQALNNEKLACESVQTLLEEKNKLINELESLKDGEQKSKEAVEGLTRVLKEVSSQAKEAKERLSSSQTEQENYENQIENLRLVLNATNEKYTAMLDDAKHEIDMLTDSIEQNKQGYQNSRTEWEQREADMMNSIKKSEDEKSSFQREISKLTDLLKEVQEEAGALKEEGARLKEAESEVVYLKEIIGETKGESMRLKQSLLDKENELQTVIEENNELQRREDASIEKIEELKTLLNEALTQKKDVANGELSENENDFDLPSKVVECYEQNGHGREEEKPIKELQPEQLQQPVEENHKLSNENLSVEDVNVEVDVEPFNGYQKDSDNKEKDKDGETKKVDVKMWEIMKLGSKDLSNAKEEEQEYLNKEFNPKVDGGENLDPVNGLSYTEMLENGGSSPSMQIQKKKKPLLQKFGSLLKKKSSPNPK